MLLWKGTIARISEQSEKRSKNLGMALFRRDHCPVGQPARAPIFDSLFVRWLPENRRLDDYLLADYTEQRQLTGKSVYCRPCSYPYGIVVLVVAAGVVAIWYLTAVVPKNHQLDRSPRTRPRAMLREVTRYRPAAFCSWPRLGLCVGQRLLKILRCCAGIKEQLCCWYARAAFSRTRLKHPHRQQCFHTVRCRRVGKSSSSSNCCWQQISAKAAVTATRSCACSHDARRLRRTAATDLNRPPYWRERNLANWGWRAAFWW